ncbi:hypothetical protein [Listeria booriae]|uniref:Uncharacterized protein n=1 Tax=Listeria booriae TaxID=1552123 RepID=A0A7X1DM40_9LIST|nr:hypothetical protein [Listeria booriae]MBC2312074.1 hypothetical protein [Listeria booriae]MBC6164708.1 hypothetical protein [Listeria booriae]
MNKNASLEEKMYKKRRKDFRLEIILKFLPCTLIIIMLGNKLTTVPPVLNSYLIIHFLLFGIITFFYTWLSLELIFTWLDIRKKNDKDGRCKDEA